MVFFFAGTVIRTTVTKVLEFERDFMCTKCRAVISQKVFNPITLVCLSFGQTFFKSIYFLILMLYYLNSILLFTPEYFLENLLSFYKSMKRLRQ